jgi:hypothetical protein
MHTVHKASLSKARNNKGGVRDHTEPWMLWLSSVTSTGCLVNMLFRVNVYSVLQVFHLIGVMISHIVGLKLPTIPPLNAIKKQVFVLNQMGLLAKT